MKTDEIALSRITENENNPRTITTEKFQKLVKSLLVFPRMLTLRPIVVDDTFKVLGGNMRLKALRHITTMDADAMRSKIAENDKLSELEVANLVSYWTDWRKKPTATIVSAADLTEAQKREFIIKDNVGFGDWDTDMLANQWDTDALKDWGIEDWQLTGFTNNAQGNENDTDSVAGNREVKSLEERFIVPPFSVLNTTKGYWIRRRNYWLQFGIRSEQGRDKNITFSKGCQPIRVYQVRNKIRETTGKDPSIDELMKYCNDNKIATMNGTSIFDPVLCECAYRWFMPDNGKYIIDPFCGGSVRGIVAAKCGFEYFGRDLRQEQISANEANCRDALDEHDTMPIYSCGDSLNIREVYEDGKADLIFSCPPYADLERYSDLPNDISNMKYPQFLDTYRKIIYETCQCLRNNRFAVWVVSEVRNKDGEYHGFLNDTINAFRDAGLKYYNDAVLINKTGSAAIRGGSLFNLNRKMTRVHQNVLVFFKGEMKSIKDNYPDLDLSYLQDMADEGNDEQSE